MSQEMRLDHWKSI